MAPPIRIITQDAADRFQKAASTDFGDHAPDVVGAAQPTSTVRQILSGLTVSGHRLVPKTDPDDHPQAIPVEQHRMATQSGHKAMEAPMPTPLDAVMPRPHPVSRSIPEEVVPPPASHSEPTDDYASLPTAEELEVIQIQAREEGFELGKAEGIKAGRAEGLAAARAEYADQIAHMNDLLTELHTRVTEQDQDVELELVDLAMTIATRVLQRELHTYPDHILAAVRQGLAQLPTQQLSARIELNPDDLEEIREQLVPDEPERRWTLVADDSLARGSFNLKAGRAELSVDIQRRLEESIDAVLVANHDQDASA
ncbi:MAG: flagellar assembly protein FliH [Gammaproteobacteria bacterium]|nr:flagellar assembly protein FliH [Gammaproteobacteria bacterium]